MQSPNTALGLHAVSHHDFKMSNVNSPNDDSLGSVEHISSKTVMSPTESSVCLYATEHFSR